MTIADGVDALRLARDDLKQIKKQKTGGLEKHYYFEHLSSHLNASKQKSMNIFPLEWAKLVSAKSVTSNA